ncbi:MAG: DKNYY domain-containing protein [Reichenbachiella sp.]
MVKRITQSKRSPIIWTLFSIASFIGQACSPFSGAVNEAISNNYYYSKSGKQIRYSPAGNWFELGNSEVTADATSFTPLESDFAKDKDHIFFKEHIIDEEVDVPSFRVVDRLGFDKGHVYIPLEYMAYSFRDTLSTSQKMFVLEGADPATFTETEDWDWGKDAKNWFYGYKMIAVDYESFTPVNDLFCKDDYQVYIRRSFDLLQSKIDPKTFEVINERYVADEMYIYDFVEWHDGEEVNRLNKFSYQSLQSIEFSHDDNYLYFDNSVIYDGALIEDANRKDFKVFESATKAYAKDEHHVFYDGHKIVDADVGTFRLYDNDQYGRDEDWVYYLGEKMEGVDVETFGPIDDEKWIYRDKDHIYVGDEIRDDFPN